MPRLSELGPEWILRGDERVALVYRCPGCRRVFLSATLVPLTNKQQRILFIEPMHDRGFEIVGVTPGIFWKNPQANQPVVADFDAVSLHPSLNADASGHWHGHIQNGNCNQAGDAPKCSRPR